MTAPTQSRPRVPYASGLLALLLATLLAATGLAQPSAAEDGADALPFRDPSLSVDARVSDLLGRLTLEEKLTMLHQYQPAIPRLGIASFKTGTEALHGLAWTTDPNNAGAVVNAEGTVFPQAVGLGSTWDTDLMERVGTAVGKEARGYYAQDPAAWSLNLWAPVVDPLRDPRAGRNEEGYSEDAFLTGTMATSYAGGMRGDDPTYLMTAPTLKHYVGYNNEVNRTTTSAQIRPRLRHEYYDVSFRMPIQADAATGVMTSYNLVNGRPMTVSPDVGERVRGWTDETLFNVTDAANPNNLVGSQDYYDTLAEADAATLKAGVDSFTTDNTDNGPTVRAVRSALEQGLLTEADVDEAVRHALTIRVRLGELDPDGGPFGGIGAEAVGTAEHRALAREAAGEAMVLLDNDGTLPLDVVADRTVAVVGPLADTLYTDWYSGALPYGVTPADGVRERLGDGGTVRVSEGVDRIALREVGSGKYVTGGTGPDGGVLAADGVDAGPAAQFDVFEWGDGVVTLRSAANEKYVGYHWGPFRNDQAQPNGWFVQQQFKLEEQPDGTYVVRYAGYETKSDWFGPKKYLTVDQDGTVALGADTPEQAARFEKEVVRDGLAEAQQAAEGADAVVVVVGSMPFINGREDHDRPGLDLAAAQRRLVERMAGTNPRTVMVLENSYPTTIGWARDTAPAALWTSHAGQETGNALADVLFGDRNPAGRLTQTWYASEGELPDITDYDLIRNRTTYQYYEGDPLYAFGHGLSYTTFDYSGLRLSSTTMKDSPVTVSVDVTNTGDRAGDEVVQLYTHQRTSRDPQPLRSLRGFERISLEPGETRTVQFVLRPSDLAHWDVTRGRWVVETSAEDLMVGAASDDVRARATLDVVGETIPARDLRGMVRAVDFDDHAAVMLVDETKAEGDAVAMGAGDWLLYRDVALGNGPRTITAQVARAAAGGATLQVRLDDPATGALVGTVRVPSTGGVYAYTTVRAALSAATGRRDVYLVAAGDLRLSRFSMR
jgi:beta-glucosidase